MAEYINRNALLESIRSGEGTNEHKIFAALCVSNAPAADVVEVVRCKDCARCDHCYPMKNKGEEAKEGYYCDYNKRHVNPNGYCSYGERKE